MRRLLLLLLIVCPVFAQEQQEQIQENIPIPEPPMPVHSGEKMEADITIVRKEKKTIHQYRRNGQLYMVKIIPDMGPPYYFIDTNGDGKMDVRRSDLSQDTEVNQWTILEWE